MSSIDATAADYASRFRYQIALGTVDEAAAPDRVHTVRNCPKGMAGVGLVGGHNMDLHSTFPLGRLVATASALDAVPQADIEGSLKRHAKRDWGELEDADREANDAALLSGERILSAYTAKNGIRLWIITERDRSATTVLLPSDY